MEKQIVSNRQDDEIEINLLELFRVLWDKCLIILFSGAVLAIAAVIVTLLFITPQYTSTTKMYVLNRTEETGTLTNQDMQVGTLLTKDYAELIQSRTVTEGVIARLSLDLDHEELLKKVTVNTTSDTRIVSISVEDPDPYMASEIANALRTLSSEHIRNVMAIEAVNTVDEANIPEEKSSPSLLKNSVIAGALGVILAMAVVLVVYFANDTIKTAEDVERYLGLSVLGNIPRVSTEKKAKRRNTRKYRKITRR